MEVSIVNKSIPAVATQAARPAPGAIVLQTSSTTPNRSRITSEKPVNGLEVVAEQAQREAALAEEISSLWFSHSLRERAMRETRAELKDYRNKLAERLSQY